jgi:hypothetical protein
MATSFVEYRSKGFWCDDAVLEAWLSFAVLELRSRIREDAWGQALSSEWAFYAQAGMMGAIDLRLDHFLSSDEKETRLLALIDAVERRLTQLGERLPLELLNPLMPPGTWWREAPPTEWFTVVGSRMRGLIQGTLLTDASSPLDYL